MENFGGEESTSAAGVDMATPNGGRSRRTRRCEKGRNYQQAAGGQQEVGGGRGEKRNWKGIIISLFVILIVFGFVILAIILSAEEETALNYVRMSDITEQKWKLVLAPDAKWNGDTLVFKDDYNNVQMWLPDDKNPKTIISNITLMENGVEEYRVSRDGKFAIFIYDKTIRNSHSYFASYTIYDIFNRTSVRLRHNNNEGDDEGEIEYVEFGRRPNDVIYVHNGDIYHVPTAQDSETRVRITQSSASGRDSKIVNGIPDWIYEEEILMSNIAHWWSNDAMFLAYAQFNDAEVMQSYTTTYTKRKAANLNLLKYPQSEYYSCPKPGTQLPQVEIKVYYFNKQTTVSVPKPKDEKMSIFQSLWWSEDNSNLFIKWSNRPQNRVILQSCHVTGQVITCRDNLTTIHAPDRQNWIPNLNEAGIGANEEGSKFYWIEPQHQGKKGFFRHIAFVDTTQTQVRSKFVTSGSSWEVERILKLEDGKKRLFFLARRRRSRKGSDRHLYRIDLQAPNSSPYCVTCSYDVTTNCSYFDAEFSRSASRLLLRCLGPTLPRSLVIGLKEDGSVDGEDWRPIGYYDKKEEERLKPGRSLFDYRYGTVETDFYDIHYQLVVPISSSGKLGLVFEVADVGVENARSEYRIEFAEFLSSHSNIVVVRFDGAGSAMRGEQVLHHVTQDPGGAVMRDIDVLLEHIKNELEDYQITGVAVMGKHFGGHVAVLAAQQQQITCAVAISPIVDWEAHTSVPSEKLLGPIETSSRNYQQNNLLYNMKNIGQDKLLVFHGLKERVVHHQQSVALHQASLMRDESRDIEMHYYADHASDNVDVERDMWSKSYSFLHDCLSSKKIRS